MSERRIIMLDSNILVYLHDPTSPFHQATKSHLSNLAKENHVGAVSHQILREFFAVMTRSSTTKSESPRERVLRSILNIMQMYAVLPERMNTFPLLLGLLKETRTSGKQIHDANIVATMLSHGVTDILTNNPGDFERYNEHISIQPLAAA